MNFTPFGRQLGISALNRALAQSPSSQEGSNPQERSSPAPLVYAPSPAPVVAAVPEMLPAPYYMGQQQPANLEPRSILGGEPDLRVMLASLGDDEIADYRSWGYKERIQFLNGYQYISTMTATGLRRPDGTAFQGSFPFSLDLMTAALTAAAPYFKTFDAQNAKAADQAATVLQDGSKVQPKAQDTSRKYVLLRDRVAWELASGNSTNPDPDKRFPPITVRYEILGTDPANPGVIYSRTVGTNPTDPDLVIEYSQMTQKELWNEGLRLEQTYEDLGVTFKKLDMSGANLRMGAGPILILGIIITVIVGLLATWWLWNHITTSNKVFELAVQNIQNDPRLSPAEKADRLMKIKAQNSFFSVIFGFEIPWTTIIIGATVAGVAFFGLPMLFGYLSGSQPRTERRARPAGATA